MAGMKLTDDQYRMIEARAGRCGVPMAVWMRSVILQVVRTSKPHGDGYIRIREPDGVTI